MVVVDFIIILYEVDGIYLLEGKLYFVIFCFGINGIVCVWFED